MAKHFTVDTGGTLTTGLVSYFKLDSDSSDYFGSHNGTDVASPTYGTGKVNNAITYNGSSQYTHFATAYSLTDASFSCWIKTSTSSGVRITSEYDTVSGSGWVLCLTLNEFTGGKPTFRLINYGVGGSTNCTGTTTVNDNAWHNIVGIRNGSTYTIWVDGSLNTTITSGNTTTTTAVLNLSGEVYGNSLFTPFPGSIDEFGIWSKALSSQEIADLYNGGSGQTMVNPTAYTATESDSIMNAASRLATVGRVSSFFRSVSATIMNAASRLASVAAIRNVPRSMSDSMMAATSVIDSGLMAWWKFDEGSGTSATDSSGNGQTLTWSGNKVGAGGTTYYATGIVGPYAGIYDGVNTSLAGSGTSYFNMGTSSFSYGGWANITGWTNGLVLMRTGGDNGTISPGFNVRTNGNTGQLSAYICDGTIRPAISINNVPVNTWCHFFVTVDTTSHVMTFYMNGVSAGTASISSLGNVTQNSSMAVGSAHYSGSLDDCRVYNRLLSAAEVARLYNVSPYPNGTVSKLVSFFRSVHEFRVPLRCPQCRACEKTHRFHNECNGTIGNGDEGESRCASALRHNHERSIALRFPYLNSRALPIHDRFSDERSLPIRHRDRTSHRLRLSFGRNDDCKRALRQDESDGERTVHPVHEQVLFTGNLIQRQIHPAGHHVQR